MPEQWAYASDRLAERYSGPFETREEAIKEGFAAFENAASIVVAKAEYPDPAEIAAKCIDVDDLLERMNEWAADNEWADPDDALFEIGVLAQPIAETSLAFTLAEWARRYVNKPTYFTARNPETVCRETGCGSGE